MLSEHASTRDRALEDRPRIRCRVAARRIRYRDPPMTAPTTPRPAPAALDPLLDDPELSPEDRVERLIAVALYDPAHRLRLEEDHVGVWPDRNGNGSDGSQR